MTSSPLLFVATPSSQAQAYYYYYCRKHEQAPLSLRTYRANAPSTRHFLPTGPPPPFKPNSSTTTASRQPLQLLEQSLFAPHFALLFAPLFALHIALAPRHFAPAQRTAVRRPQSTRDAKLS